MRPLHWLIGALIALLSAGSAGATVVVGLTSSANGTTVPLNSVFTVHVRLTWDGQGALQAVSSSTVFDPSVLELVSHTTAPASILADNTDPTNPIPGLARTTTEIQRPGDPAGILRTVQYGALAPAPPGGATLPGGRLIMTLTFKWLGGGRSTEIATILANDDAGAVGDTFMPGPTVTIVVVPEPCTALLLGLGLAGLAARRRATGRRGA